MTTAQDTQPRLFRTDDLALATYLALHGHDHDRLERQGRKCLWLFNRIGGLSELVTTYTSGEARCEPKGFMVKVADLRSEMYSFLDDAAAR